MIKPIKPAEDLARSKAIAALVDEIGDLKNLLGPFAPKLIRLDAAQRELRGHYDAAAAAEPFEAVGARYVALVGPKTKKRLIDYAALWKLAGVSVMKKIAVTTLAAIEAEFGAETAARITAEELSGPRTLKVFARQNAVKPAYAKPVCRGSFALGSACGHCERCDEEKVA